MTPKQRHKRLVSAWTYVRQTYGSPHDIEWAYEMSFRNVLDFSYENMNGILEQLLEQVFRDGYACSWDDGGEYMPGMHEKYYRKDLPVDNDEELQKIARLIGRA